MATKKAPKPATLKAGGETYTLELATAGLIALERAHDRGFMKLPELFEDTRLETLRDILAATLIAHHPQTAQHATGGLGLAVAAYMRGVTPGPLYDWTAQQALADRVLDDVGAFEVMRATGKAFYSARHMQGDNAKAGADESPV